MTINRSAYDEILKEFNDRRLENMRLRDARREQIFNQIPELQKIEDEIVSLRVESRILKLKGSSQASDETQTSEKINTLVKQKNDLLFAAGFSPADLELQYVCEKCKDSGFVDNEPCTCFRNSLVNKLYDNSHIRDILKTENFNTYTYKYYSDETDENCSVSPKAMAKDAVAAAFEFINTFDSSGMNLFIYGSCGVGKTFLTNCIARELINRGKEVIYLSAIRLFEVLSDAAFRNNDSEFKLKFIRECDLLIIDDLGTEIPNSFTQSKLFECINERQLCGKHTIISSNLSIAQLKSNYSERIFSRIASNYKLIKLIGDDIRMKKKLED